MVNMAELSDTDKEMLDLAAAFYLHGGAREAEVRERWDISSTRYWQIVNHLIDQPEALQWDAQKVNRLRRLRDTRRRQRSARARLG